MGKTFDQSLIDVATIPMSMIDPEDMADTTGEEFKGLRRVQQGCHSELTNREDFPYNKAIKTIKTKANKSEYARVEGKIKKVWFQGKTTDLKYMKDIEFMPDKVGTPQYYGFSYNPEEIVLYPTPDKEYYINVSYTDTKNIINTDGTLGYDITVGSTLRMPEWIQHLYFDALEYHVLATNLRKQSNPRWQPTMAIFEQRWKIFKKDSQSVETETRFEL